jgi:hypothetical protein
MSIDLDMLIATLEADRDALNARLTKIETDLKRFKEARATAREYEARLVTLPAAPAGEVGMTQQELIDGGARVVRDWRDLVPGILSRRALRVAELLRELQQLGYPANENTMYSWIRARVDAGECERDDDEKTYRWKGDGLTNYQRGLQD